MSQNHLATLKYIAPMHLNIALFPVGANDWNFDVHREFGSDINAGSAKRSPTRRSARTYYYRLFGSTRTVRADFVPLGGSLKRGRKVTWFPDRGSDRYLANLKRIGDTCRGSNLTCVFITQPNAYQANAPERLKDMFWMTPPAASYILTFESLVRVAEVYNRALMMFANDNGFAVCDLAAELDASVENFAEAVTECLRPVPAPLRRDRVRLVESYDIGLGGAGSGGSGMNS